MLNLTMEEKHDILNRLSECINEADENNLLGLGDKLYGVLSDLREEWDIESE